MIVTEEFIKYFDICNDYEMYGHKEEFYKMKSMFLKDYSSFAGYDLQVYKKYSVYDYRIGEVFGGLSLRYANKCYLKGQCNVPRWESTHKHILERHELFYLTGSDKKKSKIYHIPTNEFYFEDSRRKDKSEKFDELKKQKLNKVGLKHQKIRRGKPGILEALNWLKNYFEVNDIKLKQLELQFN